MVRYMSNKAKTKSRGFTLAEVVISIAVLTVGLVAAASMFGRVWGGTAYSQLMIQASSLASEKLEDLNQYPDNDPNVEVTTGSTAGSLSSNTTVGNVSYYDDVYISSATGSMSETQTINGTPFTITHTPSTITTSNTAPSTTSTIDFHRRWVIEKNPVVNGTTMTGMLRITVLVSLMNSSIQPPVTFQMSVVRP
jgi:prepilin-type N-terminal cleavage/methylation domain-containing protein